MGCLSPLLARSGPPLYQKCISLLAIWSMSYCYLHYTALFAPGKWVKYLSEGAFLLHATIFFTIIIFNLYSLNCFKNFTFKRKGIKIRVYSIYLKYYFRRNPNPLFLGHQPDRMLINNI